MKRNDLKLVGIIIIIALALFFLNLLFFYQNGTSVVVDVDGMQYGRYSIEAERIVSIYETNKMEIKDKKVSMITANCPDKLCVHQQAIQRNGETIVCLPNKIVIRVDGGKEPEMDVIVN